MLQAQLDEIAQLMSNQTITVDATQALQTATVKHLEEAVMVRNATTALPLTSAFWNCLMNFCLSFGRRNRH